MPASLGGSSVAILALLPDNILDKRPWRGESREEVVPTRLLPLSTTDPVAEADTLQQTSSRYQIE